jgi:hypothetical protein
MRHRLNSIITVEYVEVQLGMSITHFLPMNTPRNTTRWSFTSKDVIFFLNSRSPEVEDRTSLLQLPGDGTLDIPRGQPSKACKASRDVDRLFQVLQC